MGFDCGFDISPCLEPSNEEQADKWARFVAAVLGHYEDIETDHSDTVIIHTGFIEFNVGEHPLLPYDGTKFRHFSSKISGGFTHEALPVIGQVCQLAKENFGDRIFFWHECIADERNEHGVKDMFYGWTEVQDSIREYSTEEGVSTHVRERFC